MRVQHDTAALTAYHFLQQRQTDLAVPTERLSSGFRVNRAADDAAGLAISEKMRAQIRGLKMASKDVQDGVSLVQTAEGALQEVHSILQRMNELSVQAATGTNVAFDRGALDKEFAQLKEEIDDISQQTTFNNMKILDGSLWWGEEEYSSLNGTELDPATGITEGQSPARSLNGILSEITTEAVKPTEFVGAQIVINATPKRVADATRFAHDGNVGSSPTNMYMEWGIGMQIRVGGSTQNAFGLGFTLTAMQPGKQDFAEMFKAGRDQPNGYRISSEPPVSAGIWDIQVEYDDVKGATFTLTQQSGRHITPGTEIWSLFPYDTTITKFTRTLPGVPGEFEQSTVAVRSRDLRAGDKFEIDGRTYELISAGTSVSGGAIGIEWDETANTTRELVDAILKDPPSNVTVALADENTFTVTQHTTITVPTDQNYVWTGVKYHPFGVEDQDGDTNSSDGESTAEIVAKKNYAPLRIQTGALENEQLTIAIRNTSAAGLGVALHNLSSQETAGRAITAVRQAIDRVSDLRTTLGAQQNRLAYKLSSLGAATENLSASESRIRDVDMAHEMTEFTKNNILSQGATAMLAQANSLPQNVLSLLG